MINHWDSLKGLHDIVEHGQHAGHAEAHRTGLGVGRRAERGWTATKNLGGSLELGVNFQADDGFEVHIIFQKAPSTKSHDMNLDLKTTGGSFNTKPSKGSRFFVTTQSTSSSALQAFPYSDAIVKRPEWPNLKHSEQLQFEIELLQFVLFCAFCHYAE